MTLRPEPYAGLENEGTFDRLERFEEAARARGADPPTLALAWLLGHPLVTSVVVGPRRPEHLDPVGRALELRLTEAERREIGALFA
jgi:aryl-alcohol dehydrogenase-like predicted oxidoreductase